MHTISMYVYIYMYVQEKKKYFDRYLFWKLLFGVLILRYFLLNRGEHGSNIYSNISLNLNYIVNSSFKVLFLTRFTMILRSKIISIIFILIRFFFGNLINRSSGGISRSIYIFFFCEIVGDKY